jgi:hypothetical protein
MRKLILKCNVPLDWIFPDFDAEYADWGVERRALFEPDPQRHERVLQCL